MTEFLNKLELQIDQLFEPIGLPNHGAFIAHEIRINSGENELFSSNIDGWSELGRKILNLTGGGLFLARREVFQMLF